MSPTVISWTTIVVYDRDQPEILQKRLKIILKTTLMIFDFS